MDISKRNAVRIVSFTAAVVGVLAIRNIQLMSSEKTGRDFQRGKKQGARLDEHGGNAYT